MLAQGQVIANQQKQQTKEAVQAPDELQQDMAQLIV